MNRDPLNPIDEASIATYERDGVVCLRAMFDAEWVAFMAAAMDRALTQPGPHAERYTRAGEAGRFSGDLDLWQRLPEFARFVYESAAAPIAARLMCSSKVNFFYDQMLVKEPGTRERTPWHQDQPYWAVDGRQVCTVWFPVDPVPRASCVELVAGSHRWGVAFNPRHFADRTPYRDTGLAELPDIERERERHRILAWDLEPGDCLVFQAMIVHGAPGNASTQHRRRALATRWTGDDARYALRRGEVAIPTSDPGLRHGEPMDCALFPVVWPRAN